MARKTKRDKLEMTDAEYAEFQQLQHFDAASLCALALWLNKKKKNAALMKALSAEMGRNARHLARAVDFFPPYFDNFLEITANNYLTLFEYAKWKREDATALFGTYGFTRTLYQLREIMTEAKANGNSAAHKPTLAEQIIDIVDKYSSTAVKAKYTAAYDALNDITDELAALPAVKSALAKQEAE